LFTTCNPYRNIFFSIGAGQKLIMSNLYCTVTYNVLDSGIFSIYFSFSETYPGFDKTCRRFDKMYCGFGKRVADLVKCIADLVKRVAGLLKPALDLMKPIADLGVFRKEGHSHYCSVIT